jgi:chemotaxis response regulator CheB
MRVLTQPESENKLPLLFVSAHDRVNGRSCPLSVLCVSEDPLFRDRICRHLEQNGDMFVEISLSVEDALHLMSYLVFDVVVTDCTFWHGEQNGFLKTVRDQGIEIPFIYFIRKPETGIREEARKYSRIRILAWGEEQTAVPPFDKLVQCIHSMTDYLMENNVRNGFGWQNLTSEKPI